LAWLIDEEFHIVPIYKPTKTGAMRSDEVAFADMFNVMRSNGVITESILVIESGASFVEAQYGWSDCR